MKIDLVVDLLGVAAGSKSFTGSCSTYSLSTLCEDQLQRAPAYKARKCAVAYDFTLLVHSFRICEKASLNF
jgi:hypothetical protein